MKNHFSAIVIAVFAVVFWGSLAQANSSVEKTEYSLAKTGQSLTLSSGGDELLTIEAFAFNFVSTRITSLQKTATNSWRMTLELEGSDGYHAAFPESIDVGVEYRRGAFHFQASHPSFNHVSITLKDRDEHYFGLIEKLYPDNRKSPDLRGQTIAVDVYAQGEKDFAENYASAYSAFYLSSAGYASFFDTFAKGEYRLGQQGKTTIYHQTGELDWYVIPGDNGSDIHERYYQIIGAPKSLPIWALGPVVWRDYNGGGKDQILEDLRRFADLKIPLTATFVDRPYSDGGHKWSKMNFAEGFENQSQWIETINDDFNMAFMSWVGPMTFGDPDFPGLLPNHRSYIDLTHPEALAEFQRRLREQQYSVGVQGHKMDRADENFPVTAKWHDEVGESEARNRYVYLYSKTIDQFLREAHGDDQFNFARSAYHRSQPYLSAIWGGDVRPNWQGMAGNQANAMRASFMGFPVWGSDTGGYLGDGRIDETLYARWLQWSSWSGMFEIKLDGIGGQGEDRPPWKYSEQLQSIFRRACEQRMALLPYSYSLANTSATQGVLMKPLAYQYLNDEHTYSLWDQYLFGDAFMVAPVFSAEHQRRIYFPKGQWHDFHNPAETVTGPTTLTWKAPLEQIPVFVKANSLYVSGNLFAGSARTWQGDSPKSLILHVYPGAPGQSTDFEYVDYLDGDRRKTLVMSRTEATVELKVPAISALSQWQLHLDREPSQVSLNGRVVDYDYDATANLLRLQPQVDGAAEVVVQLSSGG